MTGSLFTAFVSTLSRWAWHAANGTATGLLRRLVFRPLVMSSSVGAFYRESQHLAWITMALFLAFGLLRTMWPAWSLGQGHLTAVQTVERMVTAGLISVVGFWCVKELVLFNNALVQTLVGSARLWPGASSNDALSPLLALLVTLFILILSLYLGLFYAIRAIEIYLLAALIPWFAMGWAVGSHEGLLNSLFRELVVVIFVQSAHAGAYWLFTHLLVTAWSSPMASLEACGVLWYMTRLPEQLRRLLGAPSPVRWPAWK